METGTARSAGDAGEASDAEHGSDRTGSTEDARSTEHPRAAPRWTGLPPGLLRMRRLLLVVWLVPLTIGTGLLLGLLAGPGWAAFALLPLAVLAWGWPMLGRNWNSWRYAERADDLLISRGVLWHEETVVPYGRMQLVDITRGPLSRLLGLSDLHFVTAAASSGVVIPGLLVVDAEELRDHLVTVAETRRAGL